MYRPRLAAVRGLPHAVAVRDVAADARLAAADVDDVGVRRVDRDRADGAAEILVGHRRPGDAAVGGLEDAAAGRAHPVLDRPLREPATATERPPRYGPISRHLSAAKAVVSYGPWARTAAGPKATASVRATETPPSRRQCIPLLRRGGVFI